MFESYKLRMQHMGGYDGEAKRRNSQKIMEASWMRDTATKPVYVKWVDKGLPEITDDDVPIYAKFNVKSYHNITGDEVAYLLQFRLDDMRDNPNIKIGSYVSIENELGEPEWWMIVHFDDRLQFRQYSILKCLHIYKWVSWKDGYRIVHECLGVPRSQNSYNSGVWLDYNFQVIENQSIMVLPSNDDSNTVQYDTRFIISNDKRYPPITWRVSKVQPKINGDITYFTMTQEQYNPDKDNVDLMIGDYYQSAVTPEVDNNSNVDQESDKLRFVCNGSPVVKAGGGYKKFTLKYTDEESDYDITSDIDFTIVSNDFDTSELALICENNVAKIKCNANYSLIGKTFMLSANSSEYGTKTIIVEVGSI